MRMEVELPPPASVNCFHLFIPVYCDCLQFFIAITDALIRSDVHEICFVDIHLTFDFPMF
jgi:hypothetical protein